MAQWSIIRAVREAVLLATLLASMAVGVVAGLLVGKHEPRGGVQMQGQDDGMFFATLIVLIIAVQRGIDQVTGINVLTSEVLPLMAGARVNMEMFPRVIYVLLEVGAAVGVVFMVALLLRRLQRSESRVAWIGSMFLVMMALSILRQLPAHVVGGILVLALMSGLLRESSVAMTIMTGCVRGGVMGCLIGGSFRYGFTLGMGIAISAWIMRMLGLMLGRAIRQRAT